MANLIPATIVALDSFLAGSILDRRSMADGSIKKTNDLLFAHELLALILLFAGGVKLVLPLGVLTEHVPLPGMWVRSMGVLEMLGGMFLARLLRNGLA